MSHYKFIPTFIVSNGDVRILLNQLFDHVNVGGLHSVHEGSDPTVTLQVDVRLGEVDQHLKSTKVKNKGLIHDYTRTHTYTHTQTYTCTCTHMHTHTRQVLRLTMGL